MYEERVAISYKKLSDILKQAQNIFSLVHRTFVACHRSLCFRSNVIGRELCHNYKLQ